MKKNFAIVKSCGGCYRRKEPKKEGTENKKSKKERKKERIKGKTPATYTTMTGKSIFNGIAGI